MKKIVSRPFEHRLLILDYVGHVYARTEGLVGVLISDKDYPMRPAYSLLTKILDEFLQRYPPSKFKSATTLDFPELDSVLPCRHHVYL